LRVALVVERFEPGGGVEGAAWNAAHGLAKRGADIHVIAREIHPAAAVPTLRAPVPGLWQPLRVWGFARAARRVVRSGSFDLVHAFSRIREPDLYRAGGGSHAAYLCAAYPSRGRALRRYSPRHRVLLGLEEAIFRRPGQWIQCNSEFVRKELLDRYPLDPERVRVIYNGVDLERFRPARDRGLRESLGSVSGVGADGTPRWLLLGSGFERKGLATAMRALATSTARTAVLWVAGRDAPGPWRAVAKQLGVAERVRFLGVVKKPEELLTRVDALLLPTRYDAFANACLEAAASGVPVVTSAQNGAAEILSEGALVVERSDDHRGFAAALDRLADPTARERMGTCARRRAEGYSWERHVTDLLTLYQQIR